MCHRMDRGYPCLDNMLALLRTYGAQEYNMAYRVYNRFVSTRQNTRMIYDKVSASYNKYSIKGQEFIS